MKNGGVSSIYDSSQILHKAGSRKGKTKKQIAKREEGIKNYEVNKKNKKKKKAKTAKSNQVKIQELTKGLESLKIVVKEIVKQTGIKFK